MSANCLWRWEFIACTGGLSHLVIKLVVAYGSCWASGWTPSWLLCWEITIWLLLADRLCPTYQAKASEAERKAMYPQTQLRDTIFPPSCSAGALGLSECTGMGICRGPARRKRGWAPAAHWKILLAQRCQGHWKSLLFPQTLLTLPWRPPSESSWEAPFYGLGKKRPWEVSYSSHEEPGSRIRGWWSSVLRDRTPGCQVGPSGRAWRLVGQACTGEAPFL